MNELISLKFGKKRIKFKTGIGNILDILSLKTIIPEENEKQIILNSLSAPVKSQSIYNFIKQNDRILIVIPDKTRLCRLKIVLPVVLNILKTLKINKEKIKIIFANGSHFPQTMEDKEKLIGSRIISSYDIHENNAFELSGHFKIGKTKAGTDIYLNKILESTDKIITIGAVVHHYFAGYGGGAKLIMPGIAYYKTIQENHRKTIMKSGKMHPECKAAHLKNNPVYEEIADVIRFIPPVFSISLVLNENGRILRAKSGNIIEAHKAAAKLVDRYYKIKLRKKADLVIVSAGGAPKDIDFIQSHKSINNAYLAVRENGVIISLAECRDGIGSKTFLDWFKYRDDIEFKNALLNNYTLNAQTALSLKIKLKNVKIILVSLLSNDLVESMGMIPAKNINEAIESAENILGKKYSCYIIKNGSLVVPEMI